MLFNFISKVGFWFWDNFKLSQVSERRVQITHWITATTIFFTTTNLQKAQQSKKQIKFSQVGFITYLLILVKYGSIYIHFTNSV